MLVRRLQVQQAPPARVQLAALCWQVASKLLAQLIH